MFNNYDIIVVGAGHAGCEAAVAAANMGSKVMLVTMNMQTIAQMSCNPAMGGVAKGQIVREVDAMGGYSGIVTDHTMLQFRMLNLSKGPAMWSPRAQSDRMLFAQKWRIMLESHPNIDFWQDTVQSLLVKDGRVQGVRTAMGMDIESKAVVLTNGTFLNGIIHIGEKQFGGGRAGEKASTGITEQLVELGFEAGRMKTGTPPRIDGRSLNYDLLEVQDGDAEISRFSFTETPLPNRQLPCHIAYTNDAVHEMLRTGFDQSPMFNGRIQGRGPRYCPSIEDKIDRFADKERHQLFIEPEGWETCEIYINGFSSSLPENIQFKAMRLIPGFENVKMFRPGYAIEYDYFPPTQLEMSLETRLVKGLYFAGQINGTTGYEEAACQGYMAGLNAHLCINEMDPFIVNRSEGYIGVLIDDLVNKGTDEPYRMFTSRAEFRLLLRQDNADLRLTQRVADLGMKNLDDRLERIANKVSAVDEIVKHFKTNSVSPDIINPFLASMDSAIIDQKFKLFQILSRPHIGLSNLTDLLPDLKEFMSKYDKEICQLAETDMKYEGYIQKEKDMVEKMTRLENVRLTDSFDYQSISALSSEAREKLAKIKPRTIGQASRISGVSPSDVSVLLVYSGR